MPNRCLLRRIVNREGRSRAFINGAPANSNDLAELAATLIDIHGQNEHQSLLRRDVQLDLLDHYAGAEALAARVRDSYRSWRNAADTLNTLQTNAEQSRDRRTLLEYQLGELSELAVSAGEYEDLHERFRRMSKSQDIQTRIGAALDALDGESESGVADVARIVTLLGGIDDQHAALASARELLDTALTHLDETSRELRRYLDELTSAPDELERIEARLDRISELARKHRLRPEMLAERQSELTAELSALSVSDQDLDAVRQKMHDAEADLSRVGQGSVEQTPPQREEVRSRSQRAHRQPRHCWAAASNSCSATPNTKAGSRPSNITS